jgi:hypothetical protein
LFGLDVRSFFPAKDFPLKYSVKVFQSHYESFSVPLQDVSL